MIPLTQGKFALVDPGDIERVSRHRWFAVRDKDRWYARTTIGNRRIPMHRFIMNPRDDQDVDHINHDGLDNRRSNLRVCTPAQNSRNRGIGKNSSTGYLGVSMQNGKYRARINLNGKRQSLGLFDTAEEAARARDEASKQLFGEFACLNLPDQEELDERNAA